MHISIPVDAPELDAIVVQLATVIARLGTLDERISHMATQAQVDAIAASVSSSAQVILTGLDGIRADIQALKDQANVDVSSLEANVAAVAGAAQALSDLDTENPPA